VDWVSRCCFLTAHSLGLLVSSTMVLLWACLFHCASATAGLQSSLQAPPLDVGWAFSLQLIGRPGIHPARLSKASRSPSSRIDATVSY
jgi:hypothetical protein